MLQKKNSPVIDLPPTRVASSFGWTVRNPDGTIKRKVDSGPRNMIVDQGMENIFSLASRTFDVGTTNTQPKIRVGTGTSPTTEGMAALQSPVGNPSGVQQSFAQDNHSGGEPVWFYESTVVVRFNNADSFNIAGVPLTEVGYFWDNQTSSLLARQLILDELGNPTSITLLPEEILDVSYSFRRYITTEAVTGTFQLDDDTYEYTIRPNRLGSTGSNTPWRDFVRLVSTTNNWFALQHTDLPEITENGYSAQVPMFATDATQETYVPGSLERFINMWFDVDKANFPGGMHSLRYRRGNQSSFLNIIIQRQGDGASIPKTNEDILFFENGFIRTAIARA